MRTLYRPMFIPILVAVAVGGGAMASASEASADTSSARVSDAGDRIERARGTITFRSERYTLSHQAVVSTSADKIRITDPAAISERAVHGTSLLVELGYSIDPIQRTMLRVNSGVAIRGYNFATGTYDESQAIRIDPGSLGIDSSNPSLPARIVGHLGSRTERGIDLDVTGLPFR